MPRKKRKRKVVGFFSKGRGPGRKVHPVTVSKGLRQVMRALAQPEKRRLKPLPRRVIKPMLAETGSEQDIPLHSYTQQRKYDGTRSYIIKEGTTVLMISARSFKNDYAPLFPEIVEEIHNLPVYSAIIDSELTFFKKGTDRDEFLTALAGPETKKGYVAKCMAFDVLYVNGESVESKPFEERMYLLDKIIPDRLQHIKEVKTIVDRKEKIEFFEAQTRAKQGEGVVLKKSGSLYHEGARSHDWLKVKHWKSDEAVVIGYTLGKGGRKSTFGSVVLAQKDRKTGKWRIVGKSSGFSHAQLIDFQARMQAIKRVKPPPIVGAIPSDVEVWVDPKIVLEIKYYERTKDGNFRFPAFLRERDDKKPSDCIFPLRS